MKKAALIAVVIGISLISGYCFAGSIEDSEGTTLAPEGKAYIHVEKTSEKSVGLFQPLTDFIVKTEANRAMAYSGDTFLTPDAITGSEKSIGHGDNDDSDDDNGDSGGDNGVPEELDDDNIIEAGTGTPRDADMTMAEAGMGDDRASEFLSNGNDDLLKDAKGSGLEGTVEKAGMDSGVQLGVK